MLPGTVGWGEGNMLATALCDSRAVWQDGYRSIGFDSLPQSSPPRLPPAWRRKAETGGQRESGVTVPLGISECDHNLPGPRSTIRWETWRYLYDGPRDPGERKDLPV